MLKLLVQDENGLIKTENGEPVLSCDADDVANAAIDFLGALIGADLKELISDYNQMHELIETERAENNKTVQMRTTPPSATRNWLKITTHCWQFLSDTRNRSATFRNRLHHSKTKTQNCRNASQRKIMSLVS